jgi:carboxyl-terminal processing protease
MKKSPWVYYIFVLVLGVFLGTHLSKMAFRTAMSSGAIDQIKQQIIANYVDTVDISKLNEAAVAAMLNSLDPYSAYLPPVIAKVADDELQAHFDGIGVQFRMMYDTVIILQPVSGGPSEKVGILAGDKIVSVDGEIIAGVKMSTDDVMKRLKGPKGTTVNVEILRIGSQKPLKFSIVRAVIPTYSVDVDFMVDETIGYIKLSKFSATTAKEIHEALKRLNKQGMEKLIFDLRSNGGGYLHEAIQVADEFLPDGKLIVYTEGRNRPRQDAFATRYGVFEDKPVVVLIDEMSASASEIIAGALQDNDVGTIVGRRSFGKGLVQEQIKLNNGASIRLTVARYHTPSGRYIQNPYIQGEHDATLLEEQFIMSRTIGELISFDSIKLDTTQKFVTPKGRTVYGGGGIMPDVYVPYTTDSNLIYINRLTALRLILPYTFNYSNANRKSLLKTYPNATIFKEKFEVSQELFDGFIAHGKSHGGLTPDQRSLELYNHHVRTLLKANIARDLYSDEGFYPIYLPLDDDFKKALEILRQ